MATVVCKSCGKQYQANSGMAGKRVRCSACGNIFAIPGIVEEDVVDLAPADGAAVTTQPYPGRPAPTTATPFAKTHTVGARSADEIDYEIFGDDMQYCEITLDPQEMVIAEAGGMLYMTGGIQMDTVFGDPSQKAEQGFFGKLMTAGKRMVTGESLFVTTFTATSNRRETVAFAAPYPGKILPLHLDELGGEIICQKDSFLCGARGVQIGIAFQKKIGTGLFGGEGFIMQRLTGDGIVMIHAGGTMMCKDLKPGEMLKLDTGCLVALQPSVHYDIQFVGGIKNTLFGGEGLFLATLTGPGRVWIQSLPVSRLAARLTSGSASARSGKDEGSLLGSLGNMVMGGGD